jgi:hypothetical protein
MRSLEGCTAHIVVVVQEYFGKPFLGHNLRLAPVTRVVLEARGAEGISLFPRSCGRLNKVTWKFVWT